MTKNFNTFFESIINEVLVGSKKRNKRLEENAGDINHITQMPRNIKKHPAHIRPVGKAMGNETGKHSKDPSSLPVYSKGGIKPFKNKSQRSGIGSPYSSNHMKNGVNRKMAHRREKLLKSLMRESCEDGEYQPAEEGHYILYKVCDADKQTQINPEDHLVFTNTHALRLASKRAKERKKDQRVIKVIINNPESPILFKTKHKNVFCYKGEQPIQGKEIWYNISL